MLLVKTRLGTSDIHGLGVFADERIPKGTLMWEFTRGFDLELRIEDFLPQKSYILHYGSMFEPGVYLLCGDDARFMNHSDRPNMSGSGTQNFALCDIAAGEEITCDYREFIVDFMDFKNPDPKA